MDKRDSIISVITSPLGFFALSLLIVEGFLGIVVIGSGENLEPLHRFWGMILATGSFAMVIIIVSLMVWLIPENLTYKSSDWRDKEKLNKSWGDSSDPSTKKELDDKKTIEVV